MCTAQPYITKAILKDVGLFRAGLREQEYTDPKDGKTHTYNLASQVKHLLRLVTKRLHDAAGTRLRTQQNQGGVDRIEGSATEEKQAEDLNRRDELKRQIKKQYRTTPEYTKFQEAKAAYLHAAPRDQKLLVFGRRAGED